MRIKNWNEFIKENMNNSSIPNYEECIEICNQEGSPFYEKKVEVEGYQVSLFNYRVAQWSDFHTPLQRSPNISGHELRGICFVFEKSGEIFNRYLLLEKFFNLDQTPDSSYIVVKDYKIKFVNRKEDGSIVSFVKFPNGKILARSKMEFNSDQALATNKLFNTREDIKKFVIWCLDKDIVPIFEYVSPSNKIVVDYPQEDLILLRMRDNKTGKHLNIKDYLDVIGTIKIAPFFDELKDLDKLIELTSKEEGTEGYIVQAQDKSGKDFFFKLKTPWYRELHGLYTDYLSKENFIIQLILEERLDDIIPLITDPIKLNRVKRIERLITNEIKSIINRSQKLYEEFLKDGSDKAKFATKWRSHPDFHLAIKLIKGIDPYDVAVNSLKPLIYGQKKSQEFLKKLDPSIEFIGNWSTDIMIN